MVAGDLMARWLHVRLCRNRYKSRKGYVREYWVARWYAAGVDHGRNISRSDRMGKRAARRACRDLERQLNATPAAAFQRRVTLADYAASYLDVRRGEVRPRSLEGIRAAVRRLVRSFGPARILDTISRMDGRAWRQGLLDAGLKPSTVRRAKPMSPRKLSTSWLQAMRA